jgi:streptomycin 6-kinase
VLTCESACFGSAVLKIGKPGSQALICEWNALREDDGRRFCRVFDATFKDGIARSEAGMVKY